MQVRELEVRYGKHVMEVDGRKCANSETVARVLRSFIGDAAEERFVVLHLDSRNRVTGVQEVSRGTINASLVHPREVFKGAILSNSAAIILGHNHPSGDATPSIEDREVTDRLSKAGKLLWMPVIDHVIVGGDDVFSFASAGQIPQ